MGPALAVLPWINIAAPFIEKGIGFLINKFHQQVAPSPENNAKKMSGVVQGTLADVATLVDTGTIPAPPFNPTELLGVLTEFAQSIYNTKKAMGTLPVKPGDLTAAAPNAAPTDAASGTVASASGFSLPFTFSGVVRFGL